MQEGRSHGDDPHGRAPPGPRARGSRRPLLHSRHAMRVTGAQALSRAGLSEHTIALIDRWDSATVLTYIRKAPLVASHHLAAVALVGW